MYEVYQSDVVITCTVQEQTREISSQTHHCQFMSSSFVRRGYGAGHVLTILHGPYENMISVPGARYILVDAFNARKRKVAPLRASQSLSETFPSLCL